MPELPEVETIKRGLDKKIVGRTIKNIQVLYPKAIQFSTEKVKGKTVLNIWRRAKMLGIDLSGDLTLLFHLKMTGQLILDQRSKIPTKSRTLDKIGVKDQKSGRVIGGHPTSDMLGTMPNTTTRVVFEFSDGSKLYFNDQRKFGWIKVVPRSIQEELKDLGPEPLGEEFTWQILRDNLLKHKKLPVKVALMNQSVVAGIGNIYASESLFLAKIDPRRKIESLSDREIKKLHQGIIESLEISIKYGGTTIKNYVNSEGKKGGFLEFANVYNKEGQQCKGCRGDVVKVVQAGRGTYFCPACQV